MKLTMKPLSKMIFVAIVMLGLMIAGITSVVKYQSEELKRKQSDEIYDFYNKNKDIELKNYFDLAKQSIAHLLGPDQLDEESLKKALSILGSLSFGEETNSGSDGYFFLFTQDGTFLMHPRQKGLVGRNFLTTTEAGSKRDRERSIQLKKIIEHAIDNENYVDYLWEKPSKGQEAGFFKKRAYVERIDGLGVLGTGAYLDDMNQVLNELRVDANQTIKSTMRSIIVFSTIWIALMGFVIFWFFMRDRNLVDKEIAELFMRNVKIQDQERSRISDQLHDSVKPLIIAARRKTEMGISTLRKLIQNTDAIKSEAVLNEFEDSVSIANQAIEEIKREIYKNSSLDIELLSIEDALRSYINKVTSESLPIVFNVSGEKENELSYSAKEAFSLVVREAINNALVHSAATKITVNLNFESAWTTLEIIDNGHGFNESSIRKGQGLGLRNMKERIKAENNGVFTISSSDQGTRVIAKIPS